MDEHGRLTPQVVQQSLEVRARSQRLARRAAAATTAAREKVVSGLELLVAAEQLREEAAGLVAHAVFDIGKLTGTHGLTLCGLANGEEAVLVPDLFWREVDAENRCKECVTSGTARAPY
jgi:hypothetical protein